MAIHIAEQATVAERQVVANEVITQTAAYILVNDADFAIFQWVVVSGLCQLINFIGVLTNIINIICFIRQGFKDPVNVSLLGLACSDLCSLVTLLWSNICVTPSVIAADLPFDPVGTQYLISGIPHSTFSRISGWITALVTLERCLCVTVPLKVKDIITPGRVSAIITIIFVFHIVSVVPLYIVSILEMTWSPERNKTVFGLTFKENREDFEKPSFVVNNVFMSFTAFMIIITCTVILVAKLQNKSKWRKMSTAAGKDDILSSRNQKVSKMVVTLSLLFIFCFVPVSISFLAMALVPGLSIDGKHRNILILTAWLGLVLEAINSSVNIFVYYHMSSKYREVFQAVFSFPACTI